MAKKQYPMTIAGTTRAGFRVGGFTLYDGYGGVDSVWIEGGGGEGGDFPAAKVEALIAKFYKEHF